MQTDSHTQEIPRRDKYELPIQLPDGRSRVTWKFSTEAHDIGFSARFLPEEGINSVTIIPNGRVDAHRLEQTGTYESREAGTLTLVWDNTFSTFRGKTMHVDYTIETDLGDGFTGYASSKNIVHTVFGPGNLVETRPNGSVVIDLLFGRAYLSPEAITGRQEGPLQADSIHQLHRVNIVRAMVCSNNFGADDDAPVTSAGEAEGESEQGDDHDGGGRDGEETKKEAVTAPAIASDVPPETIEQRTQRIAKFATVSRLLTEEEETWLTDATIMRYLRRTHWDTVKSYKMICDTLQWRFKDFRPQDLTFEDMAPILGRFHCYVAGRTDEGQPVLVLRVDDKEAKYTDEEKLRAMMFSIETAVKYLPPQSDPKSPDRILIFFDGAGFGVSHIRPKLAKNFVTFVRRHYVGRIEKAFVLNAPFVFWTLWKAVEPLVGRSLAHRVAILKSDTHEASLNRLKDVFGSRLLGQMIQRYPDFALMQDVGAREGSSHAAAVDEEKKAQRGLQGDSARQSKAVQGVGQRVVNKLVELLCVCLSLWRRLLTMMAPCLLLLP